MSAVVDTYRDGQDVSYAVDFGRDREPMKARSRFPEYRRKGSAPARVNGMHCRRNKRWTWGSGRGARVMNMRAFASCVAFAVATVATSAQAVTIDWRTVGNPGNPGNVIASGTFGAVSSSFAIARNETTNAQYAEFLNAVDAAGTNPNSVYNPGMTSGTFGGINFTSGAPNGSKYAAKSGFETKPVNLLTWFSAARFVNWLANGQQANASSMETGSYTLNNAVSGPIVARNPGANYFLPSLNEWYKAAYYTGSGSTYQLYPTASGTAVPTATYATNPGTNVANWNNNTAVGPIGVGSFVNTVSPYGLYDMFGNATEITDTVDSGSKYLLGGGSWKLTVPTLYNANNTVYGYNSTGTSDSVGFRVAAVPEPTTIALAGVGIASLAGLDWMKRRKKRIAASLQTVA